MGVLSTILTITTIIGQVPIWVQAIESIVGSGNGASKKDLVQGMAGSAALASGATQEQAKAIVETTGSLADATVALFNTIGLFKKSGGNQ